MAKKIYNDLINPQIKPNDLDLSMFNKPDELDLSMFDSVKKNEDSDSTSKVQSSSSQESKIDFNAPPPSSAFEQAAIGQPPVDEQSVDYLTPEQIKEKENTAKLLKEQIPFIEKTIQEIDNKAKVNIGGNAIYGFGKEQGNLLTARRYLQKALNVAKSPTQEGLKAFWSGVKRNDLTNLLSLGSTEAYRSIKTANIAKKVKNGEDPTDEEYMVLMGRYMYDIANSVDQTSSHRIGQAFAEMIPFIAQIYLTAPIGAKAAQAATTTGKKIMSTEVVNVLKKYGLDDVLKTTAQAAAQTPLTPMFFQKYAEERMPSLSVGDDGKFKTEGGESRAEAVTDAFGSTMSSIFSEKAGELIKGRVTTWGKKLGITMDEPEKAVKAIQKFRKDANWSGMGYEFLEEQLDGVGQAITTEEATLNDLFDSKRQFETLATIMLAGGAMKALEVPGYYKTKAYKKELEDAVEKFEKTIDPQTQSIVNSAINLDDVEQTRQRLASEDFSYLQPEQQKTVVDYIKAKITNNTLFEAQNTKVEKDENKPSETPKPKSEPEVSLEKNNASVALLDNSPIKLPSMSEISEAEEKYSSEIDAYDRKLAEKTTGRKDLTDDEVDDVIIQLMRDGKYKEPNDLYEKRDKPFNDVVNAMQQSVVKSMGDMDATGVLKILGLKGDAPSSLRGEWLDNLGRKISSKDKGFSDDIQRAVAESMAESRGLDFDGIMGPSSGLSDAQKKSFLSEVRRKSGEILNGLLAINNDINNSAQSMIEFPAKKTTQSGIETTGQGENIPEGVQSNIRQQTEENANNLNIGGQANAVQKPQTNEVDVRQQTGDGERMGEGDTQREIPAGEVKEENAPQTIEGLKEDLATAPNPDPVIATKLRDFASKIREGKISKIQGFKSNTPFGLAWDGALEVLATTLDTTADITVAVNKAMEYIKATDWYKGLTKGRRAEFEEKFIDHIKKEAGIDEPRLSGIKKALVPEEKIEGTDIEKRTFKQSLENGKRLIDSGEIRPTSLIQSIREKPRALQPDEVSALVYHKANLDNSFNEAYDKMEMAQNSGNAEEAELARLNLDAIRKEIDDYHEMSLVTAYEQSLAFNLRKMLLDSEYNLQTQIRKYKAINKGEIPVEVEAKFRDYEKQLEELNKKIRDLEKGKADREANEAIRGIDQDVRKPRQKRGKDLAAEGFQELMQAIGVVNMAVGEQQASVTQALSKIGKGLIDEGIATIENVTEKIKEYLNDKFKGQSKVDVDSMRDDIINSIKESKGRPEIVDGKLKLPKDIIRDYVASGMDDINEIVSAIKEDYQLEATDREIRDAITNYGKTLLMSQDEIDVKVRELKRMGKTISGLEDVLNEKQKPLRSGLQRDKLTDRERRLQKELRDAMKDLPQSEEEQAAAWKSALDAVKSRLKNQIADLQNQIETGEKTPPRKGIEYDAEAESLREQRDALKAIIEQIEGKQEISDEQKVRIAVASAERWADEYERRVAEKDVSPIRRKSTTPTTPELEAARKRMATAKSLYKDLLDAEGVTEQKRLDLMKENMWRKIVEYKDRLRNKDFAPRKKKEPPKADRDALELLALKTKLKEKFDIEVEKARLANRPLSAKINENLIDVANLPKSLIASADLSAPLRQGVILGAAHPTKVPGAFKEMFAQAFSPKRAEKWLNHVKVNPDFHIIRQSKLYLSEETTRLAAKEEQFMTNIGHKIPIWGKVVAGSERAYTGYLNKLRLDVFLQGVDHLKKQGLDPTKDSEAYKAWADFVNNASGRGNLGILEGAAPVLNATFFSPRLIASRFNLLNPVKYINMPTEVRKMALRDMGVFIGFGVMVLAIAKASGAEVEDDPRSSDFGKIKIGNLRFDVWAGFQQPVVMMSRLATGETKSSTSGKIRELSPKEYPFTTRADVVRRFFRSKMSPTAALGADLLQGETMMGEELDAGKMALERVIPLYLQDMKEIKDELGVKGMVGAGIPSLFGVGVQYYEPATGKKKSSSGETKFVY